MAEAQHPDSDFSDEELTPIDVSFNKASSHLRKLTDKLGTDQLLELYGLYKQGLDGPCVIPKPYWFDSRNRKKWEAWSALGDMPKHVAKHKYVDLVHKYDPEWTEGSPEQKVAKENWVVTSALCCESEPELNLEELTLLDAARENIPKRVSELLSEHPILKDERDQNGLTALHWAADRNASDALKAAIAGGCDVNAVDDDGQSALHYSASCGHVESTRILLEAGALLLKDQDDCTPLDVATDEEIKALLQSYQK